jgi:hypothetical protein
VALTVGDEALSSNLDSAKRKKERKSIPKKYPQSCKILEI